MEKNIEIDLVDKYDLVERYNEKKTSSNLIEYIIKQTRFIRKKEKIKIIVNKKCVLEQDCTKMIREGLKEEYNKTLEQRRSNNIKQMWLLILGVALLFLSTLITEDEIWKEILLISGWVPIWEMIEVELFPDVDARIERRIIRRLLKSEIVEKNIKIEEIIK